MPIMTRKKPLVIVLCHILCVHAFVSPPINRERIRRQSTASSVAPSTTAQQQDSNEIQQQHNIAETLWTYARNIPKASRQHASPRDQTRPVYSLVHFLTNEQMPLSEDIQEPLERATIQAVRASSSAGDYRLIFRIVEAAIHFASPDSTMLHARSFGEAIESLSRTQCNTSKLKQMWNLSKTSTSLIQKPGLTAFELNTMLRALASRGKIRAALDLYENEKDYIEGDAYTMSILIKALMDSISDDQSPTEEKSISPCWQYTEGRRLIEHASPNQLNNYVFAAALRLNERAGQVFDTPTLRHYTAKSAMDLLQLMKKLEISPDVITCSSVASAFDKAYQSKAAVALLDAMVKGGTKTWSLPAPNEYVYSSVISACARCNEYEAALKVLDRMRNDGNCEINTWVYNAALKACVGEHSSRRCRKQRAKQSEMALTLLNEMEQHSERGMNTAPDTVSYNTVLAASDGIGSMDGIQRFSGSVGVDAIDEWSSQEVAVFDLVKRMKENRISRDSLTYYNAIKAIGSNEKAVAMILDSAIDDIQNGSHSDAKLSGRAAQGMTFVCNTALSVLSSGSNLVPVAYVFSKMIESGVQPNSETVVHLLHALASSGNSEYIPAVLQGLDEDTEASGRIKEHFDIDIREQFMTNGKVTLDLNLYSAAIKSCLTVNEIDNALKVLSLMRTKGLSPDTESLEDIALAHCRLAAIASAQESKIGRRVGTSKMNKRTLQMDIKRSVSVARARSALDIALSLEGPSTYLLSTIAKACCSAGMWAEGRMMLGRVHHSAVMTVHDSSFVPSRQRNDPMFVLPGLHRSILKLCASKGNATAALGFVDDIQALSARLVSTSHEEAVSGNDVLLSAFFESIEDDECLDEVDVSTVMPSMALERGGNNAAIGMKGEDWKLLLIAASKAGHWRLCLGSLQFLKPFLEGTKPHNNDHSNLKWQSKRHDKLARSLTAAILCFEMRGQYAWAIRAIEDWIEWSGRRPRKDAVLGSFRILSTRGQGHELYKLLRRVVEVPATPFDESDSSYAEALCTGAINSLHQHGLYEDADELYLHACTEGYLPFFIDSGDVIDLHGMNVAMAHSAVRIALQQYALPMSRDGDLVIVTGRGVNSAQRLRPVLRPEVQRMLLEEFYPPLSTTSIPGNMGTLRVPSQDVKEWVMEQRQQKGVRMLALADILKTSGERIRKSIELTLQTPKDVEGQVE